MLEAVNRIPAVRFLKRPRLIAGMIWLAFMAWFGLSTVWQPWVDRGSPLFLEFSILTDRMEEVEVFWDQGRGFRGYHSDGRALRRPYQWQDVALEMSGRPIAAIRLDPSRERSRVLIRDLRVRSLGGSFEKVIDPSQVAAAFQIESIEVVDERTVYVVTEPGSFDPQLRLELEYPLRLRYSVVQRLAFSAGYMLVWLLALSLVPMALRGQSLRSFRLVLSLIVALWLSGIVNHICYETRLLILPLPRNLALALIGGMFLALGIAVSNRLASWGRRCLSVDRTTRFPLQRGPVAFFGITALFFGTLWVFLSPPYQSPDEYNWFYRAYHISEGHLFPEVARDGEGKATGVGGQAPTALSRQLNLTGGTAIVFRYYEKASAENLLNVRREVVVDPGDRVFISLADTFHSLPPYLPQAAGIALARAADFPLLDQFYAGRIVNLVTVLVLGAIAIALAPTAKWLLAVVMLNPLSLFLMASHSHDPLTNAAGFLFMAMVLRLREMERIRPLAHGVGLTLGALFILVCKFNYIVLLPLILLLRPAQFPSRRSWWTFQLSIAAIVGGALLMLLFALSLYPTGNWGQSAVDRGERVATLLSQPWTVLQQMRFTLGFLGDEYLRSMTGVLGWLDTDIGRFWGLIWWTSVVLALLLDGSRRGGFHLGLVDRLLLLGLTAAGVISVLLIFFVVWMLPESGHIMGVQGRYFLVFLPLAALACRVFLPAPPLGQRLLAYILMGMVWAYLIATSFVLLERYWVPSIWPA